MYLSLLPFKNIRVRSPLVPDEVKRRLQSEFEQTRTQSVINAMFSDTAARRYNGTWQGNAFSMYRQPLANFLFIPAVVSQGAISNEEGGSRIDVRVRMNPRRLLFALLLFIASVLVLIVTGEIVPLAVFSAMLIPLILIAGYVSSFVAMQIAARDVEQLFRRVLGRA